MRRAQDKGLVSLPAMILVTGVLGAVLVGGTFLFRPPSPTPAGALPAEATETYGRQLLRETAKFLGPDHPDPERRYSGTRMACASCHLEIGADPGELSLLQSADRYPRFMGRDGGERDLKNRINGCMQRSMNGRALPRDSVELNAMEAYILSLGERYAAMGATRRTDDDPPDFVEPDRAANVDAGRVVYEERCALCHGGDGQGLPATTDPSDGYLFPPLWGDDSYNNGAGMHRVLTAARFIKARMPLGAADLSDEQAYDVAAYMNSHPRPRMSGLERDYPDRTTKPIDSPYPPWADEFPAEQHRVGPFAPIREYYEDLANGD